ncbi:TPA: hypothetical protein ACH3X1_004832 [Trebouxia sp. C0004]
MSVLHETWAYIGQFDIIMLSETQTPATLHQQLPNHVVHTIPASTVGRRGEGLLLAIKQQLPFSITHWDADLANCVIWLTLRPSHTNQRATTIGMCYVPPETTLASQPDGRSAQLRFHALTERLLVATAQGHAVLAGDFNARVGSLPGWQTWLTASRRSCKTPTTPSMPMAANLCGCVQAVRWFSALAEPWQTPLHSLLSRLAQTQWLHAWTMFWWTQASSPPFNIVVLG